jgi:outer membrane protein TolC
MICNLFTKQFFCLIICSFAVLFGLTGCHQHDYKSEADETVYNIIDRKWQDDYGSKANYKISDVEPSPNDINTEVIIPASGILTLPQAVAIATAHNRQYQLEKELLYTKALDLRLARHAFEFQFFGGAAGGYSKDGEDEASYEQGNIGFNRLLTSGAIISTNVTMAWIDILTGDVRSGLTTLVSSTITQPLLRGSDSRIVMENLTQAERDTVYQIRSFNRYRKTFVVSVISQYYLVLQQYDFLQNARNNYEILGEILGKTEKLVNAGRLPRLELERVRQEKLKAQDILITTQKSYRQALDEFKISLGLPTTTEFKPDESELEALSVQELSGPDFSKIMKAAKEQPTRELTKEEIALLEKELELLELIQSERDNYNQDGQPTQETYAQLNKIHQQVLNGLEIDTSSVDTKLQANQEQTGFSEEDVIETALALRLDLANSSDAVYDAERKILVAEDNLRAGLNLTASTDFIHSPGKSDSLAGVGLDLDLPLDQMAEANEYRKALIAFNQSQRAFEEAVDIVVLQVRQAYRDLSEAAERYRVQLESLKLAQKRFNNTLLLMQYGRASSRRVLDAQQDLFDAQNAVTEALTNHAIAMMSFYRDTGVLQVKPDGMWKY